MLQERQYPTERKEVLFVLLALSQDTSPKSQLLLIGQKFIDKILVLCDV